MDLGLALLSEVSGALWTGLALDSGSWTLREHAFAISCLALFYWVLWTTYFYLFANTHRARGLYYPTTTIRDDKSYDLLITPSTHEPPEEDEKASSRSGSDELLEEELS